MASCRESVLDHLVLATALACWYRERQWHSFDAAVARQRRRAASEESRLAAIAAYTIHADRSIEHTGSMSHPRIHPPPDTD